VELESNPFTRARQGSRFAPSETGAVIRAHAGKLRDSLLYWLPQRGQAGLWGFENYRRVARACAVQMHLVRTGCNESSAWWKAPMISILTDRLIDRAGRRDKRYDSDITAGNSSLSPWPGLDRSGGLPKLWRAFHAQTNI